MRPRRLTDPRAQILHVCVVIVVVAVVFNLLSYVGFGDFELKVKT